MSIKTNQRKDLVSGEKYIAEIEVNCDTDLIQSVFMFIHNIPTGIVDLVWPKEKYGWMNDHIQSKYKSFCAREGYASPNAILQFVSALDTVNMKLFCEKVDQIIKSKN